MTLRFALASRRLHAGSLMLMIPVVTPAWRCFCSAYSSDAGANSAFHFQTAKRPTFEEVLRSCNVLQVRDVESLTAKELKERYRELTLQHHPDAGGTADKMRDVSQAFDVLQTLSSREKREYVKQLRQRGRANVEGLSHDPTSKDGRPLMHKKAATVFAGFSDQYRPNGRIQAEAQIRLRRKCRYATPLSTFARQTSATAAQESAPTNNTKPSWAASSDCHSTQSSAMPGAQAGTASSEEEETMHRYAYADQHRHTSTSQLNQLNQRRFAILMGCTWTSIMYLLFSGWEAIRLQTMGATVIPVKPARHEPQQPRRSFEGVTNRTVLPYTPSSPAADKDETPTLLSHAEQVALHQKRHELNESIRQARLRDVYRNWHPLTVEATQHEVVDEVTALVAERDNINAEIESQCYA